LQLFSSACASGWNERAIGDHRDHEHIHALRARPTQNTRAGTRGRPRRDHIVDKKDTPSRDALPASGRDCKSSGHIALALKTRKADLARRRPLPFENLRLVADAGETRHLAGQNGGLVEAPREEPAPRQRHRNDDLGVEEKLAASLNKPSAEQATHVMAVVELERVNEGADSPRMRGDGTRPVVGRRSGKSGSRDHDAARIERERHAEPIAQRGTDELDAAPAGGTKGIMVAQRLSADEADGRHDEVGHRLESAVNEAGRRADATRILAVVCAPFRHGSPPTPTFGEAGGLGNAFAAGAVTERLVPIPAKTR